jgi:hypothetical protein
MRSENVYSTKSKARVHASKRRWVGDYNQYFDEKLGLYGWETLHDARKVVQEI